MCLALRLARAVVNRANDPLLRAARQAKQVRLALVALLSVPAAVISLTPGIARAHAIVGATVCANP
jgi:hypothetical protein